MQNLWGNFPTGFGLGHFDKPEFHEFEGFLNSIGLTETCLTHIRP